MRYLPVLLILLLSACTTITDSRSLTCIGYCFDKQIHVEATK